MRFVSVCCPQCGLSFTVILSGRQRTAQLDRDAWDHTCPRAVDVLEPRLCNDFRAVVVGVPGEGEKPVLVGEEPRPKRSRKPGPGRGHRIRRPD